MEIPNTESINPGYHQYRVFNLITGECKDTWAAKPHDVYSEYITKRGKWVLKVMHGDQWVTVYSFGFE